MSEGPMAREAALARTLVTLADSLVADFDVVDLLTVLTDRCVSVLDLTAAGIILVSPDGVLRVMASSSEEMRVLELLELQSQEGPCLDCYRTGAPGPEPGPRLRLDPLASLRRSGPRARLPFRSRLAEAVAQLGHRRAEPLLERRGPDGGSRRRRRPGDGRCCDHRAAPASSRPRSPGHQRAA